MKFTRGTLLGLVASLAVMGAPAQAATAAAPHAEQRVEHRAAGTDWQVLKTWKNGTMRACRGKWDGETFHLKIQLVNRAERGQRGAVLGARSAKFDEWSNEEYTPIAPGEKLMIVRADVSEPPRAVKVRAKVTKVEKKSDWGKVVRADRLDFC